jgi:hypothetical protein
MLLARAIVTAGTRRPDQVSDPGALRKEIVRPIR